MTVSLIESHEQKACTRLIRRQRCIKNVFCSAQDHYNTFVPLNNFLYAKKIILISLINHQILRTNQLNIGKEILLMSIRQILLIILLF